MRKDDLNRKIIAVHLYNDYSGSPRILAQWLQHAQSNGAKVELHTSATGGILDEVDGIARRPFKYSPHPWLFLRLLRFVQIQLLLFFRFARLKKNAIVYVNTILPIGAILGARWAKLPVVCQVHEVAVRPRPLDRLLKWAVSRFCTKLIFVSDYVEKASGIQHSNTRVIANALSPAFVNGMVKKQEKVEGRFRLLMLASIRSYKGLDQFRELAMSLPEHQFELVLNGTQSEVDQYFLDQEMPRNLVLYPLQKNVHAFYAKSDVVLNLSLPDAWVETFGMTALEGMAYGLPVIVPPIGGIAELVVHGESGFHCDAYDIDGLVKHINQLAVSPETYGRMSEAAQSRAAKYDFEEFAAAIDECVAETAIACRPKSGRQPHKGTMVV